MNLFILPGPPDANTFSYTYRVVIEQTKYKIHFLYNSRQDSWSIDLLTILDEILITSIKLRMGIDLLQQFHHIEEVPDVSLIVYNGSSKEDPNADNFGKSTFLGYIGTS